MSEYGFNLFGVGGSGIVIVAIFYSAWIYRGKIQQRFSILNHFISELGEIGVSKGAPLFNISLVIGGILLLPFIVHLGLRFHSILGWLGVLAGIVTAGGVTAVGIFPMNTQKPHGHAAMAFFRGGLLMVLFFGLAILLQPAGQFVVPRETAILSLVALASFGSFLYLLTRKRDKPIQESLDPQVVSERPRFWILAFLEWMVFFSTIFWLLGLALLAL